MQSSPIIKEGSLLVYQSGLISSSWSPCYLSLQRAYLHVYESRDSTTPSENIVRSSVTRAGQFGAPNLFRFEVEFSQRSKMILQASSELEVKQWIHALMWHLLPADVRDTVPTENKTYNPHAPPAYDDVVQENLHWSCRIS